MSKLKIETVKTDKFSMDYFRFGRGKTPLVILPGLSVQSVMSLSDAVADAYQLLTDVFSIYVFDRRKDLHPAYSLHEMAQDTAEAIQTLRLGSVSLFGASQGGMMAMLIAIEHPELVRRLILGSTSACVTQTQYGLFESWVQLAKAGNATDLYLAFGKSIYPQPLFEQVRELLTEAAKTVTEEELNRFGILAEAMNGFDIRHDLEKIACPVLVIGSRDDQVLGDAASVQIKEHLNGRPDSELFLYDGYGHAAYDTAPDYKERIRRFLVPDSTD